MAKKHVKILLSNIMYLEAKGKYVCVGTPRKTYMVLTSLNHAEEVLPSELFIRIHRSYIISLLHTSEFDKDTVKLGSKEFAIGKQYKGILQEKVVTLSSNVLQERKMDNG